MYEDYADYSQGSGPPSAADISALTANATSVTGTTNYVNDLPTTGSTGGVLNSSANPVTSNSGPVDASGGNGSIPDVLQNIATQGLNDAQISANEFGLGSLTDLLRVGAGGQTTAASAPSPQTSQANAPAGIPIWIWLAGAAVVIWLVVRK